MQNYRDNVMQYGGNRQMMPPCCERNDVLEGMPLAMAYVPWQTWRKVCNAEKGFSCGTIFEELNKPFCGRGGCQR